ncbi:MAG: phosphatidylserine/phosphatidylglycerophosphate/cardiolipin synthase family protein, partial [Candidatus Binatia bacterium]
MNTSNEFKNLTYSQMVQDEFPKDEARWYTFEAKAGDVISLLVVPFPRPAIDPEGYRKVLYRQNNQEDIDPQLALYAADGDEPIARAENLSCIASTPKGDHLVYTIEQDGTYRVRVTEKYGRKVPYRLRLNLIGGPNMWTTDESDNRQLNYLGQAIYNALQDLYAPIPGNESLTYRNAVGPVLHDEEIFFALHELVANAKYEVAIRSGNITESDPLKQIVEGANQLEHRIKKDLKGFKPGEGDKPFYPVVIRIIPDLLLPFFLIGFLAVKKKKKKATEILNMFKSVDPRFVQVEVAVHHHRGTGEDHSKIVQVDGRYVHIGGANLQTNNNFVRVERDTAYLYMGEVAQLAMKAFDNSWFEETNYLATRHARSDGTVVREYHNFRRGRIKRVSGEQYIHPPAVLSPDWEALGLSTSACIPIFFLDKFKMPGPWSNRVDHPIAQGLLVAMNTAKEEINMTAPNFNDEPVIDAVAYAIARGVNVKLLLPYRRNLKKVRLPSGGGSNQNALEVLQERIALVRENVILGEVEEFQSILLVQVDTAKLKPLHEWGQFELRWWVYNGKKIA